MLILRIVVRLGDIIPRWFLALHDGAHADLDNLRLIRCDARRTVKVRTQLRHTRQVKLLAAAFGDEGGLYPNQRTIRLPAKLDGHLAAHLEGFDGEYGILRVLVQIVAHDVHTSRHYILVRA